MTDTGRSPRSAATPDAPARGEDDDRPRQGSGQGSGQAATAAGGLSALFRWISGREDRPAAVVAAEPSVAEGAARELVAQAQAFAAVRVADVMTPRADIVAVDTRRTLAEVAQVFAEAEHSRMPLYRETLDEPVGVLHVKDVFRLLAPLAAGGEPGAPCDRPPPRRLRRHVPYVPGAMPAADLLLRMRTTRTHMALVIDEYGGVDGLVTLEDLIEAVVGEIDDEHDVAAPSQVMVRGDGAGGRVVDADARAELGVLEAALDTGSLIPAALLEQDIDTVGGLLGALAGRVPQRGEVVSHPSGLLFEITDADPRRVKQVRVRDGRPPTAAQASASAAFDEAAADEIARADVAKAEPARAETAQAAVVPARATDRRP